MISREEYLKAKTTISSIHKNIDEIKKRIKREEMETMLIEQCIKEYGDNIYTLPIIELTVIAKHKIPLLQYRGYKNNSHGSLMLCSLENNMPVFTNIDDDRTISRTRYNIHNALNCITAQKELLKTPELIRDQYIKQESKTNITKNKHHIISVEQQKEALMNEMCEKDATIISESIDRYVYHKGQTLSIDTEQVISEYKNHKEIYGDIRLLQFSFSHRIDLYPPKNSYKYIYVNEHGYLYEFGGMYFEKY